MNGNVGTKGSPGCRSTRGTLGVHTGYRLLVIIQAFCQLISDLGALVGYPALNRSSGAAADAGDGYIALDWSSQPPWLIADVRAPWGPGGGWGCRFRGGFPRVVFSGPGGGGGGEWGKVSLQSQN